MPDSPVSMRDIARALGISPTAVSLALRRSPEVSVETHRQVAEAAERLGYRSHPYLRCWMADRRQRRGAHPDVTIAWLNFRKPGRAAHLKPWYRALYEGCEKRAAELGYILDEICPCDLGVTMARLDKILKNRGIRGLLISPLPKSFGHLRLDWRNYASVAIGFTLQYPDLNRVTANPLAAVELTFHHLKRAGYRRIGMIVTSSTTLKGYPRAAYLLYQQRLPDKTRIPPCWPGLNPVETVRQWVTQYRPDAVILENGLAYRHVRAAGFSAPESFGVAVQGWSEDLCQQFGLEFTGMNPENQHVGARAMELLAGQLERAEFGEPERATVTMVAPCWHVGKTTVENVRKSSQ